MKTIIFNGTNTSEVIKATIEVIKNDGLVIYPTDTVYICLVSALSEIGVSKLLEFKNRPEGKAISIFVADRNMANEYVELNSNASNIIDNLLPGPFTIICQSKHKTDLRLEAENGTLGFRIPNYPLVNQLAFMYGIPFTATSANLSGTPHHYSIDSLFKTLSQKKKDLISLIVDAGKLPYNLPSTVIDTLEPELKTLRRGNIGVKNNHTLISHSEEETNNLGLFIGNLIINKSYSKSIIVLLNGRLGAGKTIFVKGLAKSLGIIENVNSPTYNIVNEYQIPTILPFEAILPNISPYIRSHKNLNTAHLPQRLIHIDLYRLSTPEEVAEIGIERYVNAEYESSDIVAIEWSGRLNEDFIKKLSYRSKIYHIIIKHTDTNEREIEWGEMKVGNKDSN